MNSSGSVIVGRMDEIRGLAALIKFISCKPKKVLDVGSGKGEAAEMMVAAGILVMTIDKHVDATLNGDYMNFAFVPCDGIWCSHVLEHSLNVHDMLCKFKRELKPGGILAITVPPLRNKLVGGHINNFTPGTLIYNLILAGFDCSDASVYVDVISEISVLVRNADFDMPDDLDSGTEDIERLSAFFPCEVRHGIDGRFPNINWEDYR